MFFYIFIKIIVCHSIYIFAKWVILLLCCITCNGHDFPWKHEYHIYLIFKKMVSSIYYVLWVFTKLFLFSFTKSTFTIILRMYFFHIFWNICIVNFVSFPPPPPQKKSENRKAWRSLIQYYLWAPLWILFWSKKWSSYKKTIFFKLTCFSIHITNINGWSKT